MATFNDGNVPYGTQVWTINGQTFVAENITETTPSNIIERRDENGNPSGQVAVSQFVNGSATLQLATTATLVPTFGATFTYTGPGSPAPTYTGFLVEVGTTLSQTDAKKVNVNFRRKIN